MIEVGDYIRTKKKGIFKVLSIRKTPYGYYCGTVDNDNIKTFTIGKGGSAEIKNDIVKHSKNIIDLIEVGDYVNGQRVFATENRINDNGEKVILAENYSEWTDDGVVSNKDIKTIVTKEQMEAIEYRLEENK